MTAGFADLVRAMSRPGFYPDRPSAVEVIQTQMSVVFLTGNYAYKIKKPVNLGYLDYTSLEQRQLNCKQEVTLNQRLCPDHYFGVVPVTLHEGRYLIDGPGQTVEYAVKMKQLPRDRTMDVLLRSNAVTAAMLHDLAERIAVFHARAATGPVISEFGSPEAIRRNIDENFSQTEAYLNNVISLRRLRRLNSYSISFLERNEGLLRSRAAGGRVRDCHGDLHLAHVCFCDGICIFDCIEFNERFRYCDVASEIAFLAMDMDRYDRPDLSDSMVNNYVTAAGDPGLLELLDFYKCYRAMVRAKVNCFKLNDPLLAETEKEAASETARRYFTLAESYTLKSTRPVLIVMMGLVASGKSALARAVSEATGAPVVSSDVTRKQLAGVPLRERHFEEYGAGLYAREATRKTYAALYARAGTILKKGKAVVLDATFRKQAEREAAWSLAQEFGARFLLVECRCPEEETRKRLARRLEQGSISDGRWEVYVQQKVDLEPVSGMEPLQYLLVDSSRPLPELANTVLNRWGWWPEKEILD
ncbi:MAG: AAA family ATPase [Chloroflexi bacterium]|nr:AAA family ATPase [Chloroflexota bacterium]